jgi:hypothetical protein
MFSLKEIVDDLETAPEQFREIAVDLRANSCALLPTTHRQLIWNATDQGSNLDLCINILGRKLYMRCDISSR